MKALKEKRISLRSLWRRGLVILSLFALVFASCGGESDSSDDSSGPKVVRFTVSKGPSNPQYFGQPVDLTGVELTVYTSDGKIDKVTDTSKMTVYPRLVSGVYGAGGTAFLPRNTYTIIYDGVPLDGGLSIAGNQKWYIYRTETPWPYEDPSNILVVGSQDLGIHLTGYESLPKEAYADDEEFFDLSGLTLEADYVRYGDSADHRQIIRKSIPIRNVSWEIKPRYDRNAYAANAAKNGGDGYYDGFVYVTIGRMNEIPNAPYDPDIGYAWNEGGITVMLPLDKVWTVKSKDSIELLNQKDGYNKYFYWDENTKDAWLGYLGGGAQLKVTYTNNLTKTFNIADLAKKSRIYKNSNPVEGTLPDWFDTPVYYGLDLDFDLLPLVYPFTKKNLDQGVTLYYRGAQKKVDVLVFTKLIRIDPIAQQDFYPDPKWDNDIDNGEGGPSTLAGQLAPVQAIYQALNDASAQEPVTLTYYWDVARPNPATSTGLWPIYGSGPYYEFATSEDIDDEDEADSVVPGEPYTGDSTYAKGYLKYLNNNIKGKPTVTNITIRHKVTSDAITEAYELIFKGRYTGSNPWPYYPNGLLPSGQVVYDPTATSKDAPVFGPKISQNKKTKVSVNWLKK